MCEENLNPLSPGESELEAALARLAPQAAPDRRDEIAYEAGRRAGRRSAGRVWGTCSGALAAALVVAVTMRPEPRTVDRVVYQTGAAPKAMLTTYVAGDGRMAPVPGNYLAMRDDVLTYGLGALREAGGSGSGGRGEPMRAVSVQTYAPKMPGLFGERL